MTGNNKGFLIIISALLLSMAVSVSAAGTGTGASKAKILQDMTWVEVKDYLKTNDMVIIPIGSTEQHGPHLPLGTDYYEAIGISKKVSQRTGVVVAPVETGKNGATHDITNNGIISTYDPRLTATPEIGKALVEKMVDTAAAFINAWKKAD